MGPKSQGKNCQMRSASTIQRLRMYKNGKEIRNKEGKIVGGSYLMKDRSGDSKITGATGRIQPDRRWFGNSRVVGQSELDKFRENDIKTIRSIFHYFETKEDTYWIVTMQ